MVVDRDHGHPDRPGLGVGQQRRPALRPLRLDGSHEKVTLSSAKSAGPGGAHDHTRRDVIDRRRPAHRRRRGGRRRRAPTRSRIRPGRPRSCSRPRPPAPAQLDRAVDAGAPVPAGVGGAGRWRSGRPRSSRRPRRAWPPSRRGDLARLLTREHGKTHLEAIFDTATMGGHGRGLRAARGRGARRARASAAGRPGSSGCRTASSPPSSPSTGRSRSWPTRCCRRCWPATRWWSRPRPSCPGTVLLVAAAMAEVLPPGVLNVVNGPDAALGAALVGHPGVDMVSFTGGVGTGQAVMAAAAATTRPVVLELGGNDAAILAPDVAADARARRPHRRGGLRHQRPGLHGDQAALRAPRPVGRDGGRAGRPARHRGGGGRPGRRRDDGPGAHGERTRSGGGASSPRRQRRRRGAPAGPGPGRGRGSRGLLRLAGARGGAAGGLGHRAPGAVRPGAAGHPLRRPRRGGRRRPTTRPSACAPRSGATTTRWPPTWRRASRPAPCS